MAHQKILENLSCLLDGELDAGTRDKTMEHLRTCDACRLEYEGLRRLHGLSKEFKTSRPEGPSPYFETRLKAKIEDLRSGKDLRSGGDLRVDAYVDRKRLFPAFAVLTTAFIFLFIIGSTFGSFALALDRKSPAVKEKIITTTIAKMSATPGILKVLNLVTIINFCRECSSAVCRECAQCPPGGKDKDCCPAVTGQGGNSE